MGLHWPNYSWSFSSDFPLSYFLGWFHHEISWWSPLVLRSQTWRSWRACCCPCGLAYPCRYDVRSASRCMFSVIYTLLKIAWGHAAGMYFLYRSAHHMDGLHCFSYSYQRSPARSWMARWMLLPFSSWQNWHSRILPVEYFWKVLFINISPQRFPCA